MLNGMTSAGKWSGSCQRRSRAKWNHPRMCKGTQPVHKAALEQCGSMVSLPRNTVKEMVAGFSGGLLAARGMVSLVCPKPTSSGAWFVNSRLSLQGQQTILNGTRSVQYASGSSSNILHDSWRLASSSINELTACRPVLLAQAGYWDRETL